jgi:type VI secretion system secreted protein VgrG
LVCLAIALAAQVLPGEAAAAPELKSAQDFSALAFSTVTNAHVVGNPSTVVWGDVGVWPGSSITGFNPDGTVTGGLIHQGGTVAQTALADAATAYGVMAGKVADTEMTGQDLGALGYVLTPGVYHFDTSAALTGTLWLDFQNDDDASFVFQIGTTLTTAPLSRVEVLRAGAHNSLYWQVGSSATLGDGSMFAGNILAAQAVSLNAGAQVLCGRVFGLGAGVTLIDNVISNDCSATDFGSGRIDAGSWGFSGGQATPVPEPATALMLAAGLTCLAAVRRRQARAPGQTAAT